MVQALENAVWPVRPIIQELQSVTRVPGGAWRLAESAATRPPAPASDHQHVGVDQNAIEIGHCHRPRYHGRGRFFTDGCTSTICSGQ